MRSKEVEQRGGPMKKSKEEAHWGRNKKDDEAMRSSKEVDKGGGARRKRRKMSNEDCWRTLADWPESRMYSPACNIPMPPFPWQAPQDPSFYSPLLQYPHAPPSHDMPP